MTAGTAPKLFGAVEKGIAQLRQTRALKGTFVKRKNLIDTLNSRFGEAEVKATLGDFFKTHPEDEIQLDALEKAIKPVPETVVVERGTLESLEAPVKKEYQELIEQREAVQREAGELIERMRTSTPEETDLLNARFLETHEQRIALTNKMRDLQNELLRTSRAKEFAQFEHLGREFPEGAEYTERLYKLAPLDSVEVRVLEESIDSLKGEAAELSFAKRQWLSNNPNKHFSDFIKDPEGKDITDRLDFINKELSKLEAEQKALRRGIDFFVDPHFETKGVFANTRTSDLAAPESLTGVVDKRPLLLEKQVELSKGILRAQDEGRSTVGLYTEFDAVTKQLEELPMLTKRGTYPILRMIEEMQAKAIAEGVELPVFTKSWPMYVFKNELAIAAADPNIKYIGWSSGETVRSAEGAVVGSGTHTYFAKLYDMHLPKNVKNYTSRWGVEPQRIDISGPGPVREITVSEAQTLGPGIQKPGFTFEDAFGDDVVSFPTRELAEAERAKQVKTAWVLPITDQMRTDILTKGQPLDLKAVGVGAGAGALGATTDRDVKAMEKKDSILRRAVEDYLTSLPLFGPFIRPAISAAQRESLGRGLGVAFGTLNAGYAATWAAGVAVEDLKKFPDWKRTQEDEFWYVAKAMKDSIVASAIHKGEWGTTWADYHKAVTGETPQEYYGKITGTAVEIVVSIAADPLIPLDIAAPIMLAARLGRRRKLLEGFRKIPGLLDTYGDDVLKQVSRQIAGLSKKARAKFANRMEKTKSASNDFVIGLMEGTDVPLKTVVASKGGRPISNLTKEEYRGSMADAARGDEGANVFIVENAGVMKEEYRNPATRREAQKKLVNFYKTALGVRRTIRFTPTENLTEAVAPRAEVVEKVGRVGQDFFRVNIAHNARPSDVLHEVLHTKNIERGYIGNIESGLGHFETPYTVENFTADIVHELSLQNAIRNGDVVPERILNDYLEFNWARTALGLDDAPRASIPAGIRKLGKDNEALLDRIATFGSRVPAHVRISDAQMLEEGARIADNPELLADVWQRIPSGEVGSFEVTAGRIDLVRTYQDLTKGGVDEKGRWVNKVLERDFNEKLRWLSQGATESGRALRAFGVALRRLDVIKDEVRIGLGGKNFSELQEMIERADPEALGVFFAEHENIFKDTPRLREFVTEYYINNLLTTTSAHSSNFLTNLMFGTYNVFIKHPLAGVVDLTRHKLTGAERQIYLSELGPSLAALPGSAKKGAKAAGLLVRKGEKAGIERLGIKWEVRRSAFENHPSKVVQAMAPAFNGALRVMMATDVFFRTSLAGSQLAILAKRESIKGVKTFEDIMKNPPKWMLEDAERFSKRSIFFDEPGPLMKHLLKARGDLPYGTGHIIIPFMHTLTRIMARGLELTPGVGLGKLSKNVGELRKLGKDEIRIYSRLQKLDDGISKADDIVDTARRHTAYADIYKEQLELIASAHRITAAKGRVMPEVAVDQMAGLLTSFAAYDLWRKGKITGDFPDDSFERRRWEKAGITPYSVNVGGRWYRYNDLLGPFGVPMAAAVNLFNTLDNVKNPPRKGEDADTKEESIYQFAADMGTYFKEQTFIRSAFRAIDAFSAEGKWKVPRVFGATVSGLVPVAGAGIVRQFNRAREAYGLGQTVIRDPEGVVENIFMSLSLGQGIPGFTGELVPPKFDYRGRIRGADERTPFGDDKISAFAAQFFPFMRGRGDRADNIDVAFMQSGYLPGVPSDIINEVKLSRELHQELTKAAGKELEMEVKMLVEGRFWKDLAEKEAKGTQSAQKQMKRLLRKRVTSARTRARKLFMTRPEVRRHLEANRED